MRKLFALLLLLTACLRDVDQDGVLRIACIGDSNTWAGDPLSPRTNWCTLAAAQLTHGMVQAGNTQHDEPIEWMNLAYWGTMACDTGDIWPNGPWQSSTAVAQGADILIVALGTNDWGRTSAEETLACLQALAPAGRLTLFATVPVVLVPQQPQAEADFDRALNAAIRATIPAARIIDFDSWLTPDSFISDGLHVTAATQALRAEHVLTALMR